MAIYHIYVLRHPETEHVFYVGQTRRRIYERYLEHIDLKNKNQEKNELISDLLNRGLLPKLQIVDHIEMEHPPINGNNPVLELERAWISFYTDFGYILTNRLNWGMTERKRSDSWIDIFSRKQ